MNLELRGRLDGYQNARAIEGSDQVDYLHRLRITSTIEVRPWLRVVAQFQDSRVAGYPSSPTPRTISDPLDLRQGYLEIGRGMEGVWNLRVGRQPLVFGDMRLVSTSNWGNVGPNYDGVRASWSRNRSRVDLFLTEVVTPCEGFNHPSSVKKLHGLYASVGSDRTTSDFYLLYKSQRGIADHLGSAGTLRVATTGTRLTGRLGKSSDFIAEMALQTGSLRDDGIAAGAGHWEVGRKVGIVRLSGEYNYATGDRDPKDARRNSFDQLYPTNVFGTATDFGWRNLHEPAVTGLWTASRSLQIKSSFKAFWLASRRDALYLFNGSVFARNPEARESFVGKQLDSRAIWQMTRRLQIYTGYAFLLPGAYLKEAGRNKVVHYPYVMWTLTL